MEKRAVKALVTGASSGIGREIAIRLAREGFHVIASARREERLKELSQNNPNIIPRPVDLLDSKEVEDFCREISDLSEPFSVLINNAGFAIRGAIEDVSIDSVKKMFEVNLFALIRLTQACLPGMRRLRRGTIVNISSMVGKFPFPMGGIYSATKHALEAISDALRMEVRPFGIRVITIRPGVIATEFNERANQLTGDILERTDPDYKPIYQAYGEAMKRFFSNVIIPGPELIANLVMKAILSDEPKISYTGGPFIDELLSKRFNLDEDAFYQFWSERTGLRDLKL